MKKEFNPKLYQGKNRVYSKVEKGISKCWLWDNPILEYRFKYFEARKKGLIKTEDKRTFQDLKSAKNWLYNLSVIEKTDNSPKLKDVLHRWKLNHYPKIRKGSQIYYNNKTKHFRALLDLTINKITSVRIDEWILSLKNNQQRATRTSFDKELDALKTVLSFYKEHLDEPYELPIKKRHYELAFVKEKIVRNSVITEAEFLRFRAELLKSKNGLMFAALATFQFYHALRISEAGGIFKKDLKFNSNSEMNTFIIQRSLKWEHEENSVPTIEENFKNSKVVGTKTGILHNEASKLIQQLLLTNDSNSEGVFVINGKYLTYRKIQHEYDKAMTSAGLPFKSTHILRKGGATDIYNKTGSVAMVQAVLGVSSMEIAQVYAKPQDSLLQNYYKETYNKLK